MPLVSDLISFDSISIDARVKKSFALAVNAVQEGAAVSLTAIGRKVSHFSDTSEKHTIKRIDRLIGYEKLADARNSFYQQFCGYFSGQKNPLILVDWAHIDNNKWCLLRASIAFDGRAFTLYEQIYPERKMNSHGCHIAFLNKLKHCLPKQCRPIICTDAGFKVRWFREVEKLGWCWIGRIRGTVKCSLDDGDTWETPNDLYERATGKPQVLPDMLISKGKKFRSRAVLFHDKKKVAKKRKRAKRPNCASYKRFVKAYKDPWLLASNLPPGEFTEIDMVNLYKRRMTIEESFRDSKNEYYGLGLRRCKSTTIKRLQVILLILLVAQWELYIIGKAAENKGLQKHYQANTTRERRVLSYCYLACRVILSNLYSFTQEELHSALSELVALTQIKGET